MKRGMLVANIDLNEYQLTYKQIGQLYDFKKDREIVKETTAIFDDYYCKRCVNVINL